jgi:4-amino-4-deoxy-L-arabinose transferase-like glycosyltransferase
MDRRAFAVIFAGTLVRVAFWATTPVTGDASFHFSIARYMAQTHSVPTFEYVAGPNPFWWPPLFHIVSALIYSITGVLTLSPLLFGVLGLIMFNRFCGRFYPRQALSATIILAFLPFHVYYSGIGYFETLMFFLAVCAFWSYLRYIESGNGRDLAYAGFACAMSASTHYHGLIPLLAISAHLFLRNRRIAVVFLVAGLALSSPWYIRNYAVFGNPIWPKVWGGNYPNDAAVQSVPLAGSLAGLASPGRWMDVFFDFWIGAPNAGEDFWRNVNVGRVRYAAFDLFLWPWLVFVLGMSLLAVRGMLSMRGDKAAILAILVFAASFAPFAANSLARMFVSFMPFAIIAAARGFEDARLRQKWTVLAVALLAFMGASYAYAYTYAQIRAPYGPFFDEVRERTPKGAVIVMPFNVGDCIYFTQRSCARIGGTGGIPWPNVRSLDDVLAQSGVSYVCCSSLNWDAYTKADRSICDGFAGRLPVLDYRDGGVWGKCWKA